MKASLAKGIPKGYEVGYSLFTINGRMPATVPVLWIGTAERVSAIVEMNHPGVWILGDTDDDDRRHGMGIVLEYAGHAGKAQWIAPPKTRWNYMQFAKPGATAARPMRRSK